MPRSLFLPCTALLATALAPLAGARATEAPTAPLPVRVQLKVVDACRVEPGATPGRCATLHRRSDAETPAPPQVQALTPPVEAGPDANRAWHTLTF